MTGRQHRLAGQARLRPDRFSCSRRAERLPFRPRGPVPPTSVSRRPPTLNSINCISRNPASPKRSWSVIHAQTVRKHAHGVSGEGVAAIRAAAASGAAAQPCHGAEGWSLRAGLRGAGAIAGVAQRNRPRFLRRRVQRRALSAAVSTIINLDRNWQLMAAFTDRTG